MKNTPVLKVTATLVALLFLAGQTIALAATTTSDPVTSKMISGTRIETNYYNAFNVCYSATSTSTTVTKTTKGTETSTTTSTTKVDSTWEGGSLKTQTISGTSKTTGSDGSSTTNTSSETYSYTAQGSIIGASGSSTSSGNLGKDAEGNDLGTFTATTANSYTLVNGNPVISRSVTTQTNTDSKGAQSGILTSTTTYNYELIDGQACLMSTTNVLDSNSTNGNTTDITTVTTYTRDAKGLCTGIGQTKSGTAVAYGTSGGVMTSTISGYTPTVAFDKNMGWYISSDTTTWTDQVSE